MATWMERGKAGKASQAKKRRFAKSARKGSMHFKGMVDLERVIALVTEAGDRISLGLTSQGSALSVTIMNGPPPYDTMYASDEDEWLALLDIIYEQYDDAEKETAWQ